MDYSNPLLLRFRHLGRKLGILAHAVRTYRRIFPAQYEEKFDRAIFSQIRPGKVVWDVGANIGYFTTRFASAAGPSGQVVAFEPAVETFESLANAAGPLDNVKLENIALSDFDGEADFYISGKQSDTANGLFSERSPRSTKVRVLKGDTYCLSHADSIPNIIKIDVEGFEYEVLKGLSETLKSANLSAVFVEVHFSILEKRGLPGTPENIVKLFKACKFHTKWIDSSHLMAVKET